jgi:hypothetical protein
MTWDAARQRRRRPVINDDGDCARGAELRGRQHVGGINLQAQEAILAQGGPQDRKRGDAAAGSDRFASGADSPRHASRRGEMAREKARMHFDKAVGPWFFFYFYFFRWKSI